MKPFLCLLCLTPVAVILALTPVAYTFLQHVLLATATSRSNSWAINSWWNWYGSWIFFGGPFGRWIWGAVLGFRILKASRINTNGLPGTVVEQPHLRIVAMAMLAMILSSFCLVRPGIRQSIYWQADLPGIGSYDNSSNSSRNYSYRDTQLLHLQTWKQASFFHMHPE
jgi:palmitoyltransferase